MAVRLTAREKMTYSVSGGSEGVTSKSSHHNHAMVFRFCDIYSQWQQRIHSMIHMGTIEFIYSPILATECALQFMVYATHVTQ